MPMTQTGLVILAAVATLATAGMFVNFQDQWSRVALSFVGALLWGVMGLSAFDVRMRSTIDPNIATDEPILPLAYTGIALSLSAFVFALWFLYRAWRDESAAAARTDL